MPLHDIVDNFNRADAFDITPNANGDAPISIGGVRWGITGNRVVPRVSNGPRTGFVWEAGRPYVALSFKHAQIGTATYPGSGPGGMFRYIDDNNFWAAYVTLGHLYVSKFVAGVETVMDDIVGIVQANNDVWLIDLPTDNTIVVKQNGVTKSTLAANVTHNTGTKHGICGYFNTESAFDDLSIVLKFGAAAKVGIQRAPAQGANGLAFRIQPQTQICDAFDVLVSNSVLNVTASLFSGTGALIGTVTKASVGGIADWTGAGLGVSLVGVKTIRFSSGALTIADVVLTIASQTEPVEIAIVTQPSANYQSETLLPQQPTVRLLDYNGVLATTGNLTPNITVALDNAFDIINGTLVKPCVAAAAAFNDLNVNGGGAALHLVFSSPGLTSVTSAAMNATGLRSIDSVGNQMGVSELPRSVPSTVYPALITDIVTVGIGKMFTAVQAAIDSVVAADKATHTEIKIDGGTWAENLIFKKKATQNGKIILRTANALPIAGMRVGPTTLGVNRTILTSTGGNITTIVCNIQAHDYILAGLDLTGTNLFGMFYFGLNAFANDSEQPHHIGMDRCYMHGNAGLNCQRALILHSNDSYVVDSYIAEIHRNDNGDTNAITCFNGGKRILLRNTYFEGAGEIVLCGGSDPYNATLCPEDWTVQKCHFRKPLQWYSDGWQSKNIFEMKNMRRILAEFNFFENSYHGAQNGLGFNVASINQDGGAPYCGVMDVTYRYNIMRNVNTFLATQGRNSIGAAIGTRRITLHDNLGLGIYTAPYNLGAGTAIVWASGTLDYYIVHNLLMGSHNFLIDFQEGRGNADTFAEDNRRSHFDNNIGNGGHIAGQAQGYGAGPLSARLPNCTFDKNVLIGLDPADGYPATSFVVPSRNNVGFTDPTIFDIIRTTTHSKILAKTKLLVGSTYHNASADPTPRDIGPDTVTILAGFAGVIDYSEGTLLALDFPGGVIPQDYLDEGSAPPPVDPPVSVFPALGHKYLIITQQPAATIQGVLSVQPIIKLVNEIGGLDTTNNDLMQAIVVLGDGEIVSGGIIAMAAGIGTYTALSVNGSGDITLAFTIPRLPGVIASNDLHYADSPCSSRAHKAGR